MSATSASTSSTSTSSASRSVDHGRDIEIFQFRRVRAVVGQVYVSRADLGIQVGDIGQIGHFCQAHRFVTRRC